jgi:hypothetical protein
MCLNIVVCIWTMCCREYKIEPMRSIAVYQNCNILVCYKLKLNLPENESIQIMSLLNCPYRIKHLYDLYIITGNKALKVIAKVVI